MSISSSVRSFFLQYERPDALSGDDGALGDVRGVLIADVRRERRDDADAALDKLPAALLVRGDAGDAVVHERVHGVGQRADRLEQAVEDDRLKGVELELPALGGHGDGHVVADDEERHLIDDLRNDRVHLARHDRRAVLPRREIDLAEAGCAARTTLAEGHWQFSRASPRTS